MPKSLWCITSTSLRQRVSLEHAHLSLVNSLKGTIFYILFTSVTIRGLTFPVSTPRWIFSCGEYVYPPFWCILTLFFVPPKPSRSHNVSSWKFPISLTSSVTGLFLLAVNRVMDASLLNPLLHLQLYDAVFFLFSFFNSHSPYTTNPRKNIASWS